MKDHIITSDQGKSVSVLPLAAIYGANASGKSNLIKAVYFAKNLIINGTSPDESIDLTPFALDTEYEKLPTKIEFVIKIDNILYTYGFLATAQSIKEEWLFAYFSNKESKIFERVSNNDESVTVIPGDRLIENLGDKKFIEYIARGTRPNQLFINEANNKNVSIIKPLWDWFKNSLRIIFPNSNYMNLVTKAHSDSEFLRHLEAILKAAGTGVDGLHCKKTPISNSELLNDAPKKFINEIKSELQKKKNYSAYIRKGLSTYNIRLSSNNELESYSLMTIHKRKNGTDAQFDTAEESDGTLRLMHLAPMLRNSESSETVYFIDEIDRSLHPHISKLFIQIIIESIKNKKIKNQFILTTHDTNLLDRKLLRRDEIWFIEKSSHGASHLTSLAEYHVTEGLSYQNGYLNGRFGGIPFVGDAKALIK